MSRIVPPDKGPADLHALRRPDVDVITANPKTAGVARWNFLALWGHRMGKGDAAAEEFVTKVRPALASNTCKHEQTLRVLPQPYRAAPAG